jgi:hypothetical protein
MFALSLYESFSINRNVVVCEAFLIVRGDVFWCKNIHFRKMYEEPLSEKNALAGLYDEIFFVSALMYCI